MTDNKDMPGIKEKAFRLTQTVSGAG